MDGLHVGVVEVGRIGRFHARTLRALPEVGAPTVADADPARARSRDNTHREEQAQWQTTS